MLASGSGQGATDLAEGAKRGAAWSRELRPLQVPVLVPRRRLLLRVTQGWRGFSARSCGPGPEAPWGPRPWANCRPQY